jgi:hypothetical protein
MLATVSPALHADAPVPAELERMGLSWGSTVHAFWAACSPRLSPTGKYKDLCEGMAEDMTEQHGVMSVAQMPQLYRHQWTEMLTKHGAKLGWVDTFMRILGAEFRVMEHDKTALPESALKLEQQEQTFNPSRFNQSSNLGAELQQAGLLKSVTLPASVLEAPFECPDPSLFALTYNDCKAVSTAIFVWVLGAYKRVYIDKPFALEVEKRLHDANFKHWCGKRWYKVLLARFENARRKHAPVSRSIRTRAALS